MTSAGRFDGRSVWITGAASGLGLATAELFHAEGAKLTLVDIDADALQAAADRLSASGDVLTQRVDVADESQVADAISAAVAHWGQLDIAFNNAGIQFENAPLADSDTADFDRIFAVNTRSVYLCMKYQIRQMLTQGGGHIINTASAAALIAAPNRCAYTASKHAVLGLTKAAAVEYAKQKIHINAICPSVIETDMYRQAMAGQPEAKAMMEAALPMGRAGFPQEVAESVAFLASEGARFVQGHGLPVDGGFLAI